MRMKRIKLGIVLFLLLENVVSQQGYDYPKPDTPFPGRIPSSGKPGASSRLDGTEGNKSQEPGDYRSQQDRNGVSTNYSPGGPSENQRQSGIQGPSTDQRPVYPGQQIPNKPTFGGSENTGTQQPSGTFPGVNRPSSGNQQGYSYPAPQTPFSGTNTAPGGSPSSKGQQNTPRYPNDRNLGLPSGGYPSSQQGYPESQTPTAGQQSTSGYPGQQSTTSQLPSTGIQRPSGTSDNLGQYPDVSKPSSQFPSGNAIDGKGREQQGDYQGSLPFGKPSGQSGYPSGSPAYSQGKPQISSGQQPSEFSSQNGKFPEAETPRRQFPTSNKGAQAADGAGRQPFSSTRPEASPRPSNGYTVTNGPLGGSKFPDQQNPQGYPGVGIPARQQLTSTKPEASPRPSNGYTDTTGPLGGSQQRPQGYPGIETPARPQFSTPSLEKPQFPSIKPQTAPGLTTGRQTPEGYPETEKPAGRFPAFATTPTGPARQGTQSQGGFPQRPSSDYLPPDQTTGNFPAPEKSSRPQFNTDGSRSGEETRRPSGPARQPSQPAFQSGNQFSTPANQNGDSFPSNGQNKPVSPFQRPEYPTSGQPGNSQFPSPSGGSFRPEQSSGTDTSKARPGSSQAGDRPTNLPGSSGPQFGGPGGFQNNFSDQQGDINEEGDYSAIPGEPDVDYPVLSSVPDTSFRCEDQQFPGYYADIETRCQVFHVCANDKKYDFLCPNGTIFHQEYLVCVWWNQFDCSTAQSLYGINENIYDFSITGIQQTGGIPVPGSDFPSTQAPGGQSSQPQGQGRPGAPGSLPGTYPKPSLPGQSFNNLDNSGRPGFQKPEGPSSAFPSGTGGSRPSTGYPSGVTQTPGGYPDQRPQTESTGYPTPGSGSQGSRFTPASTSQIPSGSAQGTNAPGGGYPSGRPQGSTFPLESDRPRTPAFGQPQTQQSNGYPSQGSRLPSSGQNGVQIPAGTTESSITPDRYPGERPQRPNFSSGSQAPAFGQPQSQQPSGYPSPGSDSQGSRFPTSSESTQQTPSGSTQGPQGYPSGRPQGPSFPSGPARPGTPAFGQPPSQQPSAYPSSGADSQAPRFPPSGSTQGPQGYPSGRPQGPSFPSGSARPGTPAFGQPQSQQPSGYPSSGTDSQAPRFPPSGSGSPITTGPTQTPTTPQGYPSARPQGSSFESGSSTLQAPTQVGSQKPSGYPSTENGSQGSRFPSFPSGSGSQAPGGKTQGFQAPDQYPNERPQAPTFGTQVAPPQSADRSQGYPSGKPQIPGSAAGRPQASNGPEESGDRTQGDNRYPSGATQTTEPRRPGGYPERYPSQDFGFTPDSSTGTQGSPGRPGSPFPGSPKPHQPTRDYLPPVSRK